MINLRFPRNTLTLTLTIFLILASFIGISNIQTYIKFIVLLIAPDDNMKESASPEILSQNSLFLHGLNRETAPTVKRDLQK